MEYSYWRTDKSTSECESCLIAFSTFTRRHHCRDCGGVFCNKCSSSKVRMPHRNFGKPERVCRFCLKYINAKLSKEVDTAAEETDVSSMFVSALPRREMSSANVVGVEIVAASEDRHNKVVRKAQHVLLEDTIQEGGEMESSPNKGIIVSQYLPQPSSSQLQSLQLLPVGLTPLDCLPLLTAAGKYKSPAFTSFKSTREGLAGATMMALEGGDEAEPVASAVRGISRY